MKHGLLFSFDTDPPKKKFTILGSKLCDQWESYLNVGKTKTKLTTLVRHSEASTNLKQRSTGHSNCVSHNQKTQLFLSERQKEKNTAKEEQKK